VSPWLGIVIVLVADAIGVAGMLFFRARAPQGGYYNDTQQAGWVYSVAGTSFAVVLAFVFLLTFQSYDDARTSASSEAVATTALYHDADLFGEPTRDVLQGELVCYARGVIALEWPAMADLRSSPVVQARVQSIQRAFVDAPDRPGGKVGAAYDGWMADQQQRGTGRQGRLDQVEPFVPTLVWIFLISGGLLVTGFVWLFADRAERVFAQAALPIGVTTIVASGLVLVSFFDSPYKDSAGGVQPVTMVRTLGVMEMERAAVAPGVRIPCDAQGRPLRG
jgi:hypothetical protein